ncbi:MFS transporter [Arundinibacter roseus]|uniref:MFS transporter n=1 Tax=Arundinibacter roseus TaxID=2070510 RepID=A0A4R4JY71_9BACT|nr:MFS transporter [Arundinibacter roseus]TDB59840.1 MFS transporter [Arundinibacter roseus]
MNKRLKIVIIVLFFISGISSIVYQVVWQRYLTFSFGSDTLSTTIIVSIFMLGLGLGSYLGGKISDSLDDLKRLGLYVIIEIVIAVFGVLSSFFLYDILYQKFSTENLLLSIFLSFVFLLPPTVAMGSTLPLLSKLFETSLREIKTNTYYLYAFNTFGAAFGAFIPFFIIVPRLGFNGLIYFAALLNLLCVLVTILMYKSLKHIPHNRTSNSEKEEELVVKETTQLNWYLLFGVSGFIALSLEMIWFRTLHIMLKGNSFTFPVLLSIYLVGIAIGSIIGLMYLKKIKNPTHLFFRLQGLIVLSTLLSYIVLFFVIKNSELIESFNDYLYRYEKGRGFRMNFLTFFLTSFFVAIPTILMGVSFVSLQEASNKSIVSFGKKLGTLLFFNIGFSSISVIITTFFLFQYLGTSQSLFFLSILLIILFIYKILYIDTSYIHKTESSLLIVTTLICMAIFPDNQSMWKVFQGSHDKEILVLEDKSSVSTIKLNFLDSKTDVIFLNGLGQSYFPFKQDLGHVQLGYLPVLIHPDPKKIAIIGFGSGGTLYAASQSEKTDHIDCFEISTNQYDLVSTYGKMIDDKDINRLFNDDRIKLNIKDGRKALLNSDEKYDIIEADALRADSPYSGNIYSVEYFELLKSKLSPGGFAVSWAATERVTNTFAKVFPYAYTNGFMLIGSTSKIEIDLNSPVKEEFKALPIDWKKSVLDFKKVEYHSDQEVNNDLFPRDEFNYVYKN